MAIPTRLLGRAERVLNAVLDAGINLIDTSVDYGRSEELIGRYLSSRRDEFFLCSKCGCPLSITADTPTPYPTITRPRMCVRMSSRACADCGPTASTSCRCICRRRSLTRSSSAATTRGSRAPVSREPACSCAAASGAVPPRRRELGRSAAEWSRRACPAADIWARAGLDELLDGMDRHEFVLRFTLAHPWLSNTIVGTSTVEHLRRNVEMAARGPLPEDLYAEAVRRLEHARG